MQSQQIYNYDRIQSLQFWIQYEILIKNIMMMMIWVLR